MTILFYGPLERWISRKPSTVKAVASAALSSVPPTRALLLSFTYPLETGSACRESVTMKSNLVQSKFRP